MDHYGGCGSDRGGGLKVNCLICCENVDSRGRKVVNLPSELGGTPGDAFLKICELLQVSYSEIQRDWRFADGGGGVKDSRNLSSDNFPFCLGCVKGFQSVIKLQQQLVEIQKKIDEKITAIREQIRKSANKNGGGTKEANFRVKALAQDTGFESKYISTATNNGAVIPCSSFTSTSSTTLDSGWPLWSSQDPSPYVTHQQVETTPVPPTETKTAVLPSVNLHQDYHHDDDGAADDDYFGEPGPPDSDSSDQDSSTNEQKPPPRSRPRQKTFSILPSANRRLQTSRQLITRAKKSERQAEYFSPIEKTPQGQMIYEGILITPIKNKGYQCGQCDALVGKSHDSISLRKTKIHIKGFHLGAYKCALCSKNFSSNDILNQHLTRNHNGQTVPCPTCGKPIRDRFLKHHQFTHMNATEKAAAIAGGLKIQKRQQERSHTCRICEKKFFKPSQLKRHELSHVDRKFRRDFKCPHCDQAFTGTQARSQHIMRVHESLNARKRLCTICGTSVFYKDLPTHMKSHREDEKGQCRYCKKYLALRRLPDHEDKCKDYRKKGEGLEFGCEVCNKYFKDRKTLYTHRRKVHKCEISVKYRQDVTVEEGEDFLEDLNNEGIQHVEGNIYDYQLYQLEKMEGGGYKCLTCTEKFEEGNEEEELEEKVKNHVRSRHMGNFRCNKCTKRMKTMFEMQVHQRLEHSHVIVYDCDICGRMALPPKSLKKHLWLHKNVWEVADCINAGYSFPLNYSTCDTQNVLKEMGVVVNLKCGICERSGFDKVEDLYSHRREDHPEAPIVPFHMSKNPKKPGKPSKYPEGPIDCPYCGKTFENKGKFLHHRYKVHGSKRKKLTAKEEEVEEVESEVEPEGVKREANSQSEEEDTDASKSYDVGVLRGNLKRSQNVLPGCKFCERVLSSLRRLKEHEEKCSRLRAGRTKENGFIFACEICKLRFTTKKGVREHLRKVHKLSGGQRHLIIEDEVSDIEAGVEKNEPESEEETGAPDAENVGTFRGNALACKHCRKVLSRLRRLREHEEKCGLLRAGRTKENGYLFACEICGLRFTTKKRVGEHRRKVHKLRGSYRGTETEALEAAVEKMEKESDSEEETEAPNSEDGGAITTCKLCGKTLSSLRRLREHEEKCSRLRAKRTKENGFLFACEICKLRFRTMRAVGDHRRKVHKLRAENSGSSTIPKERVLPETVDKPIKSESLVQSRKEGTSPSVVIGKRKKFVIVAEEDGVRVGSGEVETVVVKVEVDSMSEESEDDEEFGDGGESSGDDLSSEEEELEQGGKKRKMDSDYEIEGRTSLRDQSSLRGRSSRNVNYAESEDEEES